MKLLKETDPRFQLLGWRVIFFVLMIVAVLLGLAAVVALKQGMFVEKTRLHFTATHGAGLARGMQVRFSGFRVGVVDKVALNEFAQVDVEILLESQYMKWIKADTTAQLLQDGLMGDYYFELLGGSPDLPVLAEDGRIRFAPMGQSIGDIAQDLKNRTLPVIDSVQDTLNYINDPKGDVRQLVANVRDLSAELKQTRAQVDQVLQRVDGLLDKEARTTLRSADQLILRGDATLSQIQTRMPLIMDGVASSVTHLESITRDASAVAAQLNKTMNEVAPQLPGLVRNTDTLVRDSSETLHGLKQSWPLNSVLPEQTLTAPVPASHQ